jgi:hypothetical protein
MPLIMPVLFRLAKKMAINSLTTIISENDRWGFYNKTINCLGVTYTMADHLLYGNQW